MNLKNLIILNFIERPCMYLVCRVLPSGKIIYVNKYLRRRYPALRKSKGWASLKNYGFVFENNKFVLKNPSKVKYLDGKQRHWQGRTQFTYSDIMNFDGRSRNE